MEQKESVQNIFIINSPLTAVNPCYTRFVV